MAFNDGDPIDAAKLGALETSIAEIKSRMPQLGSSVTNIKVDNSTVQAAVVPKIYGGQTVSKKLVPAGTVSFPINYSAAGFTAAPTSITVTPVRGTGMAAYEAYVLTGATATGATVNVYLPANNAAVNTAFYFLAIQHSQALTI